MGFQTMTRLTEDSPMSGVWCVEATSDAAGVSTGDARHVCDPADRDGLKSRQDFTCEHDRVPWSVGVFAFPGAVGGRDRLECDCTFGGGFAAVLGVG